MAKINLREKLSAISTFWDPKIVGKLNGQLVKLCKFKGEFVWHHHEVEDEFFYVIKGRLIIKMKGEDVTLNEGEFIIIPHGVEHKPIAEEEAHVLLFEPETTLNTGNIINERTISKPDIIG